PLTPLTFTALPPSRYECEVTPRRAKSVGRIIEPEMLAISRRNSANLFALEKSRTTHFHLPSYKFAHEDPRPIVSDCRPGTTSCGIRCLRCGLRRKDPSWTEIDAIVNSLSPKQDRSLDTQRHIQSKLDDEFDRSRCKAKAVYPFTARRSTELSLKMGELVTLRREIDENWLEGTNHLGEIGIFPRSYVRLLEDFSDDVNEIQPSAYSPDRPKTPKVYNKDPYSDFFDL
ncbi:SH3 domain protein, partial [Teladorsagia circumcincta]